MEGPYSTLIFFSLHQVVSKPKRSRKKVFCGCVFVFYRLKRENLDTKRLGQERKEEKGLRRGIKDKKKKGKRDFLEN